MSDRDDFWDRDESDYDDPPLRPSRTEQLRIVGAEQAGRKDRSRGDDDSLVEFPRRRSVFESIPDAPSSMLDELVDDDPSDPARFGSVPVIRLDGAAADQSAEIELPHWTAPATGQVPKVLIEGRDSDDDDTWAVYGQAPRWRDQSAGWEADEDYDDLSDLGEDLEPVGALVDRDRPAIDDFFDLGDDEGSDLGEPEIDLSEPVPAGRDLRQAVAAKPESRQSRAPGRGLRVARDGGRSGGGPGKAERPARSGRVTSLEERRAAERAAAQETGRRPPGAPERNIGLAAAAGVGLGVLAILLLRLGPAAMMLLVTAVIGIGAAEFFQTTRRAGYHPATLVGLAACAGLPAAAYWRGEAAIPLVLFLATVFALLWYLFGVDQENPAAGAAVTLLGVGYVGVLGSFAALILRQGAPTGTNMLLAAIIPTVAADVFGYVVGRNAGRSPLSSVSPNKTVEGLLGGIAGAVIASVLVNDIILSLEPFDGVRRAALLGAVVAVVAPLGDLCESLLKRSLGVKDMGQTIPGHGGVLDRFDALLFVLPATYYLYLILGPGL
jgi:phosphatidate cytidylyltransferase